MRERFERALLRFDVVEAGTVVHDGLRAGMSGPDVCAAVIAPVMVAIGDLWHAGRITVGDEHVATGLAAPWR